MHTLRLFAFLGSVLVLGGMLASCGSLPQPFRHAEGDMVLVPDLAGGVIVYPVKGDREGENTLAEALVYVLNVAEIPATLRAAPSEEDKSPMRPSFFDAKTVIVAGEIVGDRRVVWRVSNRMGEELGEYVQEIGDDGIPRSTPQTLRSFAQRGLPGIIALLPIDRTRNMAGPAHIHFLPVTDAPGDGDVRLTSAMRVKLKEAGFVLTDRNPTYILTGNVLVSPYEGGMDLVTITWLMTYPDGMEFARIQQANPVPKGTMSLPWGNLANLIAEGGVMGVQEAVQKKISKEGGELD